MHVFPADDVRRVFCVTRFNRGTVFLDGHGTPQSRFFPPVVAFFPLSVARCFAARASFLQLSLRCGAAAAGYGVIAGRSQREVRVLATVTPFYALGHGLGMWRGAFELLR